ncbi:MAG: hypothetical protein M1817_000416 [Caeruleum heppii]|nr:MAG: hypothetical protein M1817_000416 [Caeruleum heppii]
MAGHNDPRLLYSIPNIRAYHLQDGGEQPLTPSGGQTLSLLMVPTSSPFAGLSSAEPQSSAPEEDFYLHLHLPPELDLPLPATTQIYHQPPTSYLIPRWDMGPQSGAFTRIEFPGVGTGSNKVSQEDVDTFETILAQCTAFLERAPPGSHSHGGYPDEKAGHHQQPASYNPQDFKPGEGYAHGGGMASGSKTSPQGQIVLVDEENGSIVGELGEGFNVVENPDIKPGSKNPVQISLPSDPSSNQIDISTAPPAYLKDAMHPAYKSSRLVSNAAMASRLIVTTSGTLSNMLTSSADSFTKKTKPNTKPMTFTPTTHDRVRKLNTFTQGAAGLSAKTVGQVGKYAQNLGATLARRGGEGKKPISLDKDGNPVESYGKPGLLNKSMMAFSTIADGIDQAGRDLLASGSTAATTVVGHRYGTHAGQVAGSLAGGAKNVGLVYIDAMGVSRKAVVKSVAKGMVIGRVNGGGDLVVGGGDGGAIPPETHQQLQSQSQSQPQAHGALGPPAGTVSNQNLSGSGQSAASAPGTGEVGFGNAAPPAYGSGLGEPLGGAGLQGQDVPSKYR